MYNIDEIKSQFNKVICNSQFLTPKNTEQLFKDWEENKKYFIEAFGGNLIYQHPEKVKVSLNNTNKDYLVMQFAECVGRTYGNLQLEDFILKNKEGFFENEIFESCVSSDGQKIQKGMKLIKAFKFFEKDENTLRRIQDDASQLIQSNKLEGYLCISVHPLDYLSSSENNHNWRSCHSLDGEHRSGNLSYMADPSTVVCYLKGEDDFDFYGVPWNSKKWRMLLHFSNSRQLVIRGRQYPARSEELLSLTNKHLLSQAKKSDYQPTFWFEEAPYNSWSNWKGGIFSDVYDKNNDYHIHLHHKYIPLNGKLYKLEDIVSNYTNKHYASPQYNDVLYSSCYTPEYSEIYSFSVNNEEHIDIGHEVACLNCGNDTIYNGETMMCLECEIAYGDIISDDIFACDCCNGRGLVDYSYTIVNEYGDYEYVCESCADTETFVCDRCGYRHYNSEKRYDAENDRYLCAECYYNE